MTRILRVLLYLWVAPTSTPGLIVTLLTLLTGGHARVVNGVLEVWGSAATWLLKHATLLPGGASALTLGHVVLGTSPAALDLTRPHERVHVRQCERWGPLFIPAYLGTSAWCWLRGRRIYHDNPFEREAFAKAPLRRGS